MENLEIIQQVEQFYNSAWDKLIITGSIIFAIFGILIPFFFQFIQNRQLKLQEKEIKLDINDQLSVLKKDLHIEIKAEYEKEFEKLSKKFEQKSDEIKGMAFHLQGNTNFNAGFHTRATKDFLFSVEYYVGGKDYNNLRTVINTLKKNCFTKITSVQLEDIFHQSDMTKESYFEKLKKLDIEGLAQKEIIDLKYEAGKLKAKLKK